MSASGQTVRPSLRRRHRHREDAMASAIGKLRETPNKLLTIIHVQAFLLLGTRHSA
jgi:hypothetical protein